MLDKARYIVVEGPIGVGKTSLARRLADHLQAPTLFEKPEENPFLGRFYQNMERYALQTQLFFLFQRMEQLREVMQDDLFSGRLVADFLIDKDPLFASMNLTDDEYALYRQIYASLKLQAPAPDLVIYLQADADTLAERVRRRGLDAERRISESYLARVVERYARFFYQYDASPLFIVNAEELNPVDSDDDFALLVERLGQMRSFREFFGYAS
ncbi:MULTISPECIES: deoxynucleoside kinase [Methyloversatilis]|jgi:deoxyguanosine kinase|uniref:deoxynucleoside kinase n=1 Tax=Methyloversatilis TaxID=378210 RepID=UPI000371A005|nr:MULTISPECIES: deoxynucleoside kinase [Methyloversatilis]MBL8469608.1 deoxynucleoside kinase [Methyloversatilis discipulorum]MBT9517417.1 deoxynucleoside kinase [Methyloversatilis discipulorum]MCR6665613.1 deoxynucleoside kinase [Methyloversatilis sp.]PZU53523.1 MAG: deoxynucleoside kinase [Thauera sp.]